MTFEIFRKTGEYKDANGDWDGDTGFYEEVKVPDEKVHKDCAEMIYNSYFSVSLLHSDKQKQFVLNCIERFVNDLDCWDEAIELFLDELKDKYGRECDDD